MNLERSFDFIKGEIVLINKPYKWTSFDVISKIKLSLKKYAGINKIKIGHAGTLDPLATGLLIICTGSYTKKIDEFQSMIKEYTGIMTIGATTPSGDLEKEINQTFDISNINEELILEASKKFVGEIQQTAPAFSAKKINGIRAYEYARKGEIIDIKPSTVNINEFNITKIVLPEIHFHIICTKGTYIRSLAVDFGEALNNGAYLSALNRTKIGNYKLEDAYEIEDFINIIRHKYQVTKQNEV